MNKANKILIVFTLTGVVLAGCASNEKSNPSSVNPSDALHSNSGNTKPHDANDKNAPTQGGKPQPSENQVADYAGGFSIRELESALRKTGAITVSGEPYDVSGTNMTTATRYGNIVIGTYKEELVDEALAYYQKGSMQIQGKEVKVVNMIGNYLLIVLEGDIDQKSIAAFSAVGGL